MNSQTHKGPGLRVHPPIIYLAALLVGVGLNYCRPISFLPGRWGDLAGIA